MYLIWLSSAKKGLRVIQTKQLKCYELDKFSSDIYHREPGTVFGCYACVCIDICCESRECEDTKYSN